MSKELVTADKVFEALGGISGVQQITGDKYKTVHQWKASGSFPSNTYVLLTSALEELGFSAPAALWDQREPVQAAS